MLWKELPSVVPAVVAPPITETDIMIAINAYSIAVAPDSFSINDLIFKITTTLPLQKTLY